MILLKSHILLPFKRRVSLNKNLQVFSVFKVLRGNLKFITILFTLEHKLESFDSLLKILELI